jgi:hypothetical protein
VGSFPNQAAFRDFPRTDADVPDTALVGVLRNYCNHNLATRQVNELIEEARLRVPNDDIKIKNACVAPESRGNIVVITKEW